jgi:DGQHR domain-containing protein
MPRPPRQQGGKKHGRASTGPSFSVVPIKQGEHTLYSFAEKASALWEFVSINRREENKDEGYQRVLSTSRVRAVADYILEKNVIPGSITIAIDKGTYKNGKLTISGGKDVAWVIDGQHRLAGAHLAATEGTDIELNVIGLLNLDEEDRIEQFVTINREGRNVPTSLYLDLLKLLPKRKSPSELASERAADIAKELRQEGSSIFHGRIVVTTSPKHGQLSIVNFVRKLAPYVNPQKGLMNRLSLNEQAKIIDNYFSALKKVYPNQWSKSDNIFFKTIGFGAIMNVFEDVFKEATIHGQGFRVTDVVDLLLPLKDFDFEQWREMGTGNKAEGDAAQGFLVDFARALDRLKKRKDRKTIRLV